MSGTYVEICKDGSQCQQCGQPTNVKTSRQWAVFNCEISGNQLKVIQNNNYAAFCEVIVSDDEVDQS